MTDETHHEPTPQPEPQPEHEPTPEPQHQPEHEASPEPTPKAPKDMRTGAQKIKDAAHKAAEQVRDVASHPREAAHEAKEKAVKAIKEAPAKTEKAVFRAVDTFNTEGETDLKAGAKAVFAPKGSAVASFMKGIERVREKAEYERTGKSDAPLREAERKGLAAERAGGPVYESQPANRTQETYNKNRNANRGKNTGLAGKGLGLAGSPAPGRGSSANLKFTKGMVAGSSPKFAPTTAPSFATPAKPTTHREFIPAGGLKPVDFNAVHQMNFGHHSHAVDPHHKPAGIFQTNTPIFNKKKFRM